MSAREALRFCVTCVAFGCCSLRLFALPQESDTVILKQSRTSYTILSEVSDAQERQAFTALYNSKNAGERQQLANRFLAAYPQSWLLAQAYDLDARALLDLDKIPEALEKGKFSLRLQPENPTLLVLIANAEAQAKQFDQSIADAQDALEYLDLFTHPGAYSEEQWSRLKPQLKASAYFAQGRAAFAKALGPPASWQASLLAQARDALDRAAAWNPDDAEIFYLRGLVEIKSGDNDNARSDLAFVARSSHPLHIQAEENFRRLYRGDPPKESDPSVNRQLREESTESRPSAAILAGYAGSSVCQSCHPNEFQTWRQTGMARMLREFKRENIMGDFSDGSAFEDESGKAVVRMGSAGGGGDARPSFEIRTADGAWQRFRIDYTIGSKWQQAYATKLPDGSLHVIPIQYNSLLKSWVNYWKIIDPPGSPRDSIASFSSLQSATNYQQNCAICHTSQLRAAPSGDSPMEHAEFREPGVDCEMCHGPSAWHVKRARSGQLAKADRLEPPVDFRKIDNRSGVRVCAQCHRQSAVREIGAERELNYSATSASYVAKSFSQPFDTFSRRAFFKDGRFRETTFIVEAFTRSACYRKGTAQCASCHGPHVPDFPTNLTSLKFDKDPDEMCLVCHNQIRQRVAQHTHHAMSSEGSRCVSCHMPRIVNALLFKARSHEIEIPRADLTKRFGQDDSPNACLICHAGKDAAWAANNLERWQQ